MTQFRNHEWAHDTREQQLTAQLDTLPRRDVRLLHRNATDTQLGLTNVLNRQGTATWNPN